MGEPLGPLCMNDLDGYKSIPTRSHGEAMEWSLVLASQGIEPILDRTEADDGWRLVVSTEEYARAAESLELYRLENAGWPWRHRVALRGYLFDWGGLAWVLLIGFFYWLDARRDLRSAGMMDTGLAAHGEWWRPFTAVWLHADASHLATNATIGFLLLGLALGRFGTGSGLLAAYLAGAVGNLLPWWIGLGAHRSLGSSGMVMGALGLLAAQSLALDRQAPAAFRAGTVLAGTMLFVLLGLTPGTDVLAHLGGFVAGLLFGIVLVRTRTIAGTTKRDSTAGLLFTLLVIAPWWLALRKGY